jgi:hypothetical protein
MTHTAATTPQQLFLDCDGVLADFDRAAEQVFGMPARQAEQKLGASQFWRRLRNHEDFYGTLPLRPDAQMLFEAVRHLNPIILTGCPLGGWAEQQKHRWAAVHFPGTRMITCMAREKHLHMKPGDVLVDDFLKYKKLWEDAGGIFIHHTSAERTIGELQQIGML